MTDAVKLRVLSLDAGVQSTTLALLAAHGEVGPMPDCAIFADTGWEPRAVYDHLEWLMSPNVLPFQVLVVKAGIIRDDLINRGSERALRFITVPFYLLHKNGAKGMGRRQCTTHYKIEPVRKKVRELLGAEGRARIPAGSVEKWIGISLDEIVRATPSRIKFEVNRHPLLELRMSRRDCLDWLRRNDYPTPPKSACIGCPFHTNAMWREMRDNDPTSWADAVEIDRVIREPADRPGIPALRGRQFMHSACVPLDEVDLSIARERGQSEFGFMHECQGMCGL